MLQCIRVSNNILYTTNLHNAASQLYLSDAEKINLLRSPMDTFNCVFIIFGDFYSCFFLFNVVVQFEIQWTAAFQASLSFAIPLSLSRLISFESLMLTNHLILYHPFLLLPSIFPSIRIFSNEITLPIRGPK